MRRLAADPIERTHSHLPATQLWSEQQAVKGVTNGNVSDLESDCRTWGDENNEIALLVGLKLELNGDRNNKSGKKLFVCSAASAADAGCLNVAVGKI